MILLIIILSAPLCLGELYGDYCGNGCETDRGFVKHTVCERAIRSCSWGARCGIIQRFYMTDELRQLILDKHNELRNRIALGQETTGSQPAASNMNILNYNFELEFIAQCHANSCIYDHDKCRNGLDLLVGQNLAVYSRTISCDFQTVVNASLQGIQAWYDEVEIFKPSQVERFNAESLKSGHYTQLVWADIEYLGCGLTVWDDFGWYHVYLVCNYGGKKTGGNLLGAPVYKKGDGCSLCPAGKSCNEKYKGLCGKVIPITEVDRGIFGRSSRLKFVTLFGTRNFTGGGKTCPETNNCFNITFFKPAL